MRVDRFKVRLEIFNVHLEIFKLHLEIFNGSLEIFNVHVEKAKARLEIFNVRLEIFNVRHEIFNVRHEIFNVSLEIFKARLEIFIVHVEFPKAHFDFLNVHDGFPGAHASLLRGSGTLRHGMPGILGADSLVPVSDSLVTMVSNRFGGAPRFWGRYFKRPGFAQDYQPQLENAVFNASQMQLLPIARQTNRVAGTASDGAADAVLNVDAFTGAMGVEHLAKIGGEMLMFLDVEGTSTANPNLSLDYWIGWSAAIANYSRRVAGGRFAMVPGVYCRQNQSATWQAVATAATQGFACGGAWVFRMHNDACSKPLPDWEPQFNTPSVALPCPVMLWQFAIDCLTSDGIDFDLLNPDPAAASALLNRLVLPPA